MSSDPILLIVFGSLGVFFILTLRRIRVHEKKVSRAQPILARVRKVGPSAVYARNPKVSVVLGIDVPGPKGTFYTAQTHWLVEPAAIVRLQAGEWVAIRVDADNPNVIYPDVEWASY